MNITITGDIGAGKSTVAKRIASILKMNVVEAGDIYRKYSENKGLNVLEQNKTDDWSIDKQIDHDIEEMGKKVDNTIFVSRLAWHFVKDAVKVYISVNPIVAAKRIVSATRIGEKHNELIETYNYNTERKKLELDRYKEMYNLDDPSGYSNADIVIVIGQNGINSVVNCIIAAITNEEYGFFIDPRIMIPTQTIRDYNVGHVYEYVEAMSDASVNKPYVPLNIRCDTYKNMLFYILDGHHRVAASILRNSKFIKIPKPDKIDYLIDIPRVYDYEDFVGVDLSDEVQLIDLSNISKKF